MAPEEPPDDVVSPALVEPSPKAIVPPKEPAITRTVSFAPGRSALVVLPRDRSRPPGLLVMIHGVCTPTSYVCGAWKSAAADVGILVCPNGNATCGDPGQGPPTWEEPFADIDTDVENAVAAARKTVRPRVPREGAVLAGFSRGAYAAVIIAMRHPGRWPFLILNEADVDLTPAMMRAAGIRAVALIAGEWGTQIAGERRTVDALVRDGLSARLWVMQRVGHAYSNDIDDLMSEALAFVLTRGDAGPSDAAARDAGEKTIDARPWR